MTAFFLGDRAAFKNKREVHTITYENVEIQESFSCILRYNPPIKHIFYKGAKIQKIVYDAVWDTYTYNLGYGFVGDFKLETVQSVTLEEEQQFFQKMFEEAPNLKKSTSKNLLKRWDIK